MAMLERMVKPNARVSTATATATTVGGKRKARGAANAGGGGVADTEARNLLHKLERKVRSEGKAPSRYRGGCSLFAPDRRDSGLLLLGSGSRFLGAWIVRVPGCNGSMMFWKKAKGLDWIGSFSLV